MVTAVLAVVTTVGALLGRKLARPVPEPAGAKGRSAEVEEAKNSRMEMTPGAKPWNAKFRVTVWPPATDSPLTLGLPNTVDPPVELIP
jgi:hypothetical protein